MLKPRLNGFRIPSSCCRPRGETMDKDLIFNPLERELLEAARMLLRDGVERLKNRASLLPSNQTPGRAGREACRQARDTLATHLCAEYGTRPYETAVAVLLDPQGRLIAIEEFPRGKATHVELAPRILAEFILRHGAACVLLAHNHPSGDNTPSKADVRFTEHIAEWLKAMDTILVDHLVLNGSDAASILGDW